jgi:NAD(P)H-dependent FMN reductase
MKITLICGSQRNQSETVKIGKYIQKKINVLDTETETFLLDLSQVNLPFAQSEEEKQNITKQELWESISKELNTSDAFVVLTPEWNGMATPAIKNFFLLCKKELAHKPGLLVGISSSRGGAYPIQELRSSGYKNTYIVYIPDHLIIRDCKLVLNQDSAAELSPDEIYLSNRINYSLSCLFEYSKALSQVRNSGIIDLKTYPNGM